MAAIIAFGTLAFASCDNVTVQNSTDTNTSQSATDFEYGGFIVGGLPNENGVSLLSVPIESSEYMTYNIPQSAESAVLVTATLLPQGVEEYVTITWTTKWSNPSSAWASGKTVTDYVTVAKAGKSTATVTCLQPFGEQVEVVCRVTGAGVTLTDSVTCDYMVRPESIDWSIAGNSEWFGSQDSCVTGTFTRGSSYELFIWRMDTHNMTPATFSREGIFGGININSQTTGTISTTSIMVEIGLTDEFILQLEDYGFEVEETKVSFKAQDFDTAEFVHSWFYLPGAPTGIYDLWESMHFDGSVDGDRLDYYGQDYINYMEAIASTPNEPFYIELSLTNADASIIYETYRAVGEFGNGYLPELILRADSLTLDGDITF